MPWAGGLRRNHDFEVDAAGSLRQDAGIVFLGAFSAASLDAMTLTGNWKIADIPEPKRYVLYAQAYLEASHSVALRMRDDPEQHNWPNASVALLLAAHALELFLKGAILSRVSAGAPKVHRLDELATFYLQTFPEPEFHFDMPFQGEYHGFSESEIFKLKRDEQIHSILFRYPTQSAGVEWKGIHAFEAQRFLDGLADTRDAFSRIGDRISQETCNQDIDF